MKTGQMLQGIFRRGALHLTSRTGEPLLTTEHARFFCRLKGPGEADGAGGNTIDVFGTENAGGGHGNVGGAVMQGAERHFAGHFYAGQIEGFDGVRIDVQQPLFGLGGINDLTALDEIAAALHSGEHHHDFAGSTRLCRGQDQRVTAQVVDRLIGDGHDTHSKAHFPVDRNPRQSFQQLPARRNPGFCSVFNWPVPVAAFPPFPPTAHRCHPV